MTVQGRIMSDEIFSTAAVVRKLIWTDMQCVNDLDGFMLQKTSAKFR